MQRKYNALLFLPALAFLFLCFILTGFDRGHYDTTGFDIPHQFISSSSGQGFPSSKKISVLTQAKERIARLLERQTGDFGKANPFKDGQVISSGSLTGFARAVTPNRIPFKIIALEQPGCNLDIHLPRIINRRVVNQVMSLPLAVVMPTPRSPPSVVLSYGSRATAC